MKTHHLTKGVMAALLFASPFVGAESKYPAADFQPEVIYQDEEYIGTQKSAPAAKAPAASKAKRSSASDSKYPAADFQPEVIFQDPEQIEKVGRSAAPTRRAPAARSSSPSQSAATEEKSGGLMENYWLGLVLLALAGFAVYSKRSKPESEESGPAFTVDASGLTGVARYVRMKNMAEPTGVQKYIEKHGKEFTGVEKYLRRRG